MAEGRPQDAPGRLHPPGEGRPGPRGTARGTSRDGTLLREEAGDEKLQGLLPCRGRVQRPHWPRPGCTAAVNRERGLSQGRSEPRISCPLVHRLWSARSWDPGSGPCCSHMTGDRQSQESGNFTGFWVTVDSGQQAGKPGRKSAGQRQPGDPEQEVVCHAFPAPRGQSDEERPR